MLKYFTLLFAFAMLSVYAQDSTTIYSVYFDVKASPGTEKLSQIDAKYHQKYTLVGRDENDLRVASGDELVVDATGIYIEKNRLLSISRTEIRENSAYTLREGYLHGILPNDSVLVALDGELYYFLIPTKTYLYEVGGRTNQLYRGKNTNEFLVFTKEDNGYLSALKLSFSGKKISLSLLDLEQTNFDFKRVTGKKIMEGKIPVYILLPKKEEWTTIFNYFVNYDEYEIAS